MYISYLKKIKKEFFRISLFSLFFISFALDLHAEEVTGGGYIVNQVISPLETLLSNGGFSVQQAGQIIGDISSSTGFLLQAVFGTTTIPSSPGPVIPSPSPSYGGGGGGWSNPPSVWGYYVLPPSSIKNPPIVATTSTKVNTGTILTTNGSTCSTRIALSSPVDFGLKNNPDDVKKIETFLNTYEGEKLKVDGLYAKEDFDAVKKWQTKYKTQILTPVKLKKPTGTVYTSSMRQIERQSTATCGQQIVVHTCPYFKKYVMYGDTGSDVTRIQQFLNISQGEKLQITGKYDAKTREAAKRFQRMYRKDIISIVTLSFISGNWNVSTRTKANEVIGCDKLN